MKKTTPAVLFAAIALATPAAAHASITAIDPSQGGTATTVAQAIIADPAQLDSAGTSLPEYAYGGAGAPSPIGTGNNAPGVAGFPTAGTTYGILTSGQVNDIASLPPDTSDEQSFTYEQQHVPLLNPPNRGLAKDYTRLQVAVNVPSNANCLAVDYRFFSEEYPEYVGSPFNDALISELDTSNWAVDGDGTLTRPADFATAQNGKPVSVNGQGPTSMYPSEVGNTYFNAATGLVTTKTPITPGSHTVNFSIFDANDHILDSAVFLDNLRFVSESAATCQPPNTIVAPVVTPGPAPTPVPTPPSSVFTLGSAVRFGATGTSATITVNAPGPGTLTAGTTLAGAASLREHRAALAAALDRKKKSKKKKAKKTALLKRTTVKVAKAGPVKLKVSLSSTGAKLLKKRGKLTVPVTITFTRTGGKAASQVKSVTFKKPKAKKHASKKKHAKKK